MKRLLLVATALVSSLVALGGCADDGGGSEGFGIASDSASITYGAARADWSDFPDGMQCLVAIQTFYRRHFHAEVPIAGGPVATPQGTCASQGACNIWFNPANHPDATVWERHAWGSEPVQPYDMVVFPPYYSASFNNPYGHIAAVDHVDGAGRLFIMDDNWNDDQRKARAPHDTAGWMPAGFYRLRALSHGGGGGSDTISWSCADSASAAGQVWTCHDGNAYRCNASGAPEEYRCELGCYSMPSGQNDRCLEAAPGWNCANSDAGGQQYWTCSGSSLFRCYDGAARVARCWNGCRSNGVGHNDSCL